MMRRELEQEIVQRGPLLRRERCEELVLDAPRDRPQLGELLLPGGLQADQMASPVGRVAPALDVAVGLELVEEADEPAPVVPEGIGDRRLRLARALVEDGEHGVPVRALAGLLEGLDGARLERESEALEQERRAGHE